MFNLKGHIRDLSVKAAKYRKLGFTPAVIYGRELPESIGIMADEWRLVDVVKRTIVGDEGYLDIDGEQYHVVLKDYTLQDTTGRLEHVDFHLMDD